MKSLNGVEIEELGKFTKEGNFVFTWAWMLLKNKGLTRGEEQVRRQFGLMLYIQQYFINSFKDAAKSIKGEFFLPFPFLSLQTFLFPKMGESSCSPNEFNLGFSLSYCLFSHGLLCYNMSIEASNLWFMPEYPTLGFDNEFH
jgi:hypothetical protein